MSLIADIKGLDIGSYLSGGVFAQIGASTIPTDGLEVASIFTPGTYWFLGGAAPEPPAPGLLQRLFPGLPAERTFPAVQGERTFPL